MPDILTRLRDAYAENPASALAMLPELLQAVDRGKIVELPCKVGDTVYAVANSEIIVCKVIEFTIKEDGISFIRLYSDDDRIADYRNKTFKKAVFLTREAAEEAIKERE